MQSASNKFNVTRSRGRGSGNTPYSDVLGLSEKFNDIDGIPPSFLRSLGPFAPLLLSDDYHDPDKLQLRLRIYSLSLLGTSVVFWVWALCNTISLRRSGGFDLGVVSFLGSGLSSSLLLRSSLGGSCCKNKAKQNAALDVYGAKREKRKDASPGHELSTSIRSQHAPPGKCLLAFSVLTQLTVVANYMLGLLFAFTAGSRVYVYFATYCLFFSLLWTVIAFSGYVLASAYREAAISACGEDFTNPSKTCFGVCLGAWMTLTNQSVKSRGNNIDYGDDEEEEIDEELRALYEGDVGFTSV